MVGYITGSPIYSTGGCHYSQLLELHALPPYFFYYVLLAEVRVSELLRQNNWF